jgi:FkbM family methyltransferase
MGVYDLAVSEVLWRLADPGELAVDVGANVGYMTSIMAKRLGKNGSVISFEPHPELYEELVMNIGKWKEANACAAITAKKLALSNRSGEAWLHEPADFAHNRGSACLDTIGSGAGAKAYLVPLATLDNVNSKRCPIGIIKIDVEGHELQVLQGSVRLIKAKLVRDIVFEEHARFPSAVTKFVQSYGYAVFRIWKGFAKPLLLDPLENRTHPWEPPNYLATIDPSRAKMRLGKRGWFCLLARG